MKAKVRKFLSVLKIELEDVEEDLELLLDIYKQGVEKKSITEYVGRENSMLARQEIAAIKLLLREIGNFSAETYETLDSLEKAVLEFFGKEIERREYPAALRYVVERKVQKVRGYIEEGCE